MSGAVVLGPASCLRESDEAILVDLDPDSIAAADEPIWIPKRALAEDSEVTAVGDEGELVVEAWFAAKRGWSGAGDGEE